MSTSIVPQSTLNAQAFIVSHGGQYHPGWHSAGSSYDPTTGQFTPDGAQRVKDAAKNHEAHFLQVMVQLKALAPADSGLQNFDVRSGHTWQDVLDAANMARLDYQARARGIKGLFKRVGMKIGDLNPAVDPILQTLPCGDYTALVCGGVILIFKAFARMSAIRGQVMDMLDSAPWLLEQVEAFAKLYPKDVKLADKVDQLYTAVLRAIIASIKWLGHSVWDRVKVVAQQTLYGQDIEECAKIIQQCKQNLTEQAALCDKEKTVEIYELLTFNTRQIQELKAQSVVYELNAESRHSEQMHGSAKLSAQMHIIETNMQDQRKTDESKTDTLNSILKLLSNQESSKDITLQWLVEAKAEHEKERRRREAAEHEAMFLHGQLAATRRDLQRSPSPTPALSQDEVRQLLWDSGERPDDQIERHAKLDIDHGFLSAGITAYRFQRWFTSRASQILCVTMDGATDPSTGSGFVAAFAKLCKQLPEATTITYFCGRQALNPGQDPVAALLASLIVQSLPRDDTDLRGWSRKLPAYEHHRQLGLMNPEYLKSFLKYLLLPKQKGGVRDAGAVFCLIDDFATLEQEALWESFRDLIMYLKYRLVTPQTTSPVVLKVLLMRPDRRGGILRQMDDEEVVSIGATAPGLSRGQSDRELDFQLERARRME